MTPLELSQFAANYAAVVAALAAVGSVVVGVLAIKGRSALSKKADPGGLVGYI